MFLPESTLTVENARTSLEAGLAAITSGQTEIDLAMLSVVDSTAVATLLAWQRAAQKRHATLVFKNLPPNLLSLVTVYGVTDLLQIGSRAGTQQAIAANLHH
jgi:phospholipid transport system transporter-binding protein